RIVSGAAERHEPIPRLAHLPDVSAEIAFQQLGREIIVTGCDGGVGREDDACGRAQGGIAEALALEQQGTRSLARGERGVTLVQVDDLRLEAGGAERAHAADAEEDLLLQTVLVVAAIQAVGDAAILGPVLRNVRVEQEERDAPHVGPPDARERAAVAEREIDEQARAILTEDGTPRQQAGVGLPGDVLLSTLLVVLLP